MYWKMSIDLTRPQVSSMGQHDPLDGYITTVQLRTTAASLPGADGAPDLAEEPALDVQRDILRDERFVPLLWWPQNKRLGPRGDRGETVNESQIEGS